MRACMTGTVKAAVAEEFARPGPEGTSNGAFGEGEHVRQGAPRGRERGGPGDALGLSEVGLASGPGLAVAFPHLAAEPRRWGLPGLVAQEIRSIVDTLSQTACFGGEPNFTGCPRTPPCAPPRSSRPRPCTSRGSR